MIVVLKDKESISWRPAKSYPNFRRFSNFFFFLSRPERDIKIAFDEFRSSVHQYNLSEVFNDIVNRDISLFVQTSLLGLARRYPGTRGTSDWQSLEMQQALVTRAAGLFMWVYTAVEFIGDGDVDDPESQREVLFSKSMNLSIQGSPSTILHSLYLQVLNKAYSNRTSPRSLTLFREIVGSFIYIRFGWFTESWTL
ncbi:hypothetical protein SERLA73DRAFT_178463 [Serpula lacrymans var. lacrymans S7.3]|uniref:Uncharacterized protein n=1 Tax=Serpula lacrymans var. lacrymans (strain S7.3) TaxID=936435 RepID=F8PRP3_SERL3|nr:hypothetical protein SERLA73DRAFT_178463 [Serpula lacrymans var. lacrymans S7.3]